MGQAKHISVHDQIAAQYDQLAHEYQSYGHDLLFGMSFEYLTPGDNLLDLGIGTGLASQSFAQAGINIFGCDGSAEMLKVCAAKGFTQELQQVDIEKTPLPYPDSSFDHVLCCGVLHFFDNLDVIVQEVQRINKPGGTFSFTVAETTDVPEAGYVEAPTAWEVSLFRHCTGYLTDLLHTNHFDILKAQRFLTKGEEHEEDILFTGYITRKSNTM